MRPVSGRRCGPAVVDPENTRLGMILHELAPVTIASAFLFGMILALLGSIKLPLAQRLGIDEARVGGLLATLNLALIPMMLVSGILIDKVGVQGVLFVGSLMTALAFFGIAMSRT